MKKHPGIYSSTILFLGFSNSPAQFTHTFTQLANLTYEGYPRGVTLGPDSTVSVANTDGGLNVYIYEEGKLKKATRVNN